MRGIRSAFLLATALIWIATTIIDANTALVGTTAMSFIRLDRDAKSEALAHAITAKQDLSAFSLNPSSISGLDRKQIKVHYLSYFEAISYKNIKLHAPSRLGNLSLGFGSIQYGSQVRTTQSDTAGISSGSFDNVGYSVHFGVARSVKKIAYGTSLRYVSQTLDTQKSDAVGLNLGLQYDLVDRLKLGLAYNNITLQKSNYDQLSAVLPEELRAGVYYRGSLFSRGLDLGVDLISAIDSALAMASGLQVKINPFFAIRAGYNPLSDLAPYSLGMGLSLNDMSLDFTYKPSDQFDESYRVGFGYQF